MPRKAPSYPFAELAFHEVKRVVELLREALELSGRSQREVERKLGVSQGYVTQLLTGRTRLKVEHTYALGKVIGFTPLELFTAAQGTGWPRHVRARFARGANPPEQEPVVSAVERDLHQLEAGLGALVRLLDRAQARGREHGYSQRVRLR